MGRAKLQRVSKACEAIHLSRDGKQRQWSSDFAATMPTAHARAALPVSGHIRRIGSGTGRFERKMGEATTRSALRLRAYARKLVPNPF